MPKVITLAACVSGLMVFVGLLGSLKDVDTRVYQELDDRLRTNYGFSATCDEHFTLSSDCRTSEVPEVLVWGDSFAMQVVPGILASKSDAKIIPASSDMATQ